MKSIFEKNVILQEIWNQNKKMITASEELEKGIIEHCLERGTMVLLGNPAHRNVKPLLVGQPAKVKINANLGTSPMCSNLEKELQKVAIAGKAGADTIMDLSIAGNLDEIRLRMLESWDHPLGTVPMYAVGQKVLGENRPMESMKPEELFNEIKKQASQGVDFMTLHCGLTRRGAELAAGERRKLGIVSRGGSMLARWMLENGRENPLYEYFDDILEICLQYNVTISLGDGLRPGAGIDAGDAAQWEEVVNLGLLAERALEKGVQTIIEGPGHVALNEVKNQIVSIKRLTHNAPLYVLGPLCCDSAPGYDHIAGAVGGSIAVEAGVDFLCYLTPAEHLTLPDENDVYAGVLASRIAAHIGEVASGRPFALAREELMNRGRKSLDWEAMEKAALDPEQIQKRKNIDTSERVCAMCGKFCAVKMMERH